MIELSKVSNETIFDQRLFEVGEYCYAIAASVTEPFLYTRFRCTVAKRKINNDAVTYFLAIEELLETKEWAQLHVHRNRFRTWHTAANRGQLKSLDCFDLLVDMSTFEQKFSKRYRHLTLVVSSVHVAVTREHINAICEQTVDIVSSHLKSSLDTIRLRHAELNKMAQ